MAEEGRGQDHLEPGRTAEGRPATGPAVPGGGPAAPVTACRPLGALELGFNTRLLWTLQAGVWAVDFRLVQSVDNALDGIRRCLLVLSDRVNQVQDAHFTELATRIEDRHDAAAAFKGGLMAELFDEQDDPDAAMRAMPGRIEQRATVLRGWQRQDWDAARVLAWKAVEGDRRLEGWWEVGFRLADMSLPVPRPGEPNARSDGNVRKLHEAIDKLPDEERAWVRDALPVVPPSDERFADILNEAYREYRAVLPRYETRASAPTAPRRSGATFVASDKYAVVWWRGQEYKFNETQAVMVKALHDDLLAGKPGLSPATLFAVARRERSDLRVEYIFRHQDKLSKKWVIHPALADRLLVKVGRVWRLGIENPG